MSSADVDDGAVLEEVAAAADAIADEQRQVARQARRMQRQRDQGAPWRTILEREREPGLLGRLRHNARRLGDLSARVASTFARGLVDEGESHRQIGRRLGVSHQRVSAIVNAGDGERRSDVSNAAGR